MSENWYLVLGLEFEPNPVHDQAEIDKKITEMQKFWARNSNHMIHGAEYKKYMKLIPEIRKAMSDPEERKRMIKEACDITNAEIDKWLKLLRKREVTEDEVNKIADRQKVSVDAVKRRAAALNIKVIAEKTDFQKIYDKYYSTPPRDARKFSGMEPLLKTFNAENLYSFLYAGTEMKDPENLPSETLYKDASDKKTKFSRPNDDIHSSGRRLCDHCLQAFKDDSSKDAYDKYLEYKKRKDILDKAKNLADISGELNSEQVSGLIDQLTELSRNRGHSIELLTAFCKVNKIIFDTTAVSPQESADLRVCRCGCTNDVSDGRRICWSCGTDLYFKCPDCETVNEAFVKVCKCGFRLENINNALALCDLAEHAINMMDFDAAQARLTDARHYWPGSERVRKLAAHLKDRRDQVGDAADAMRKAVAEKRYYGAGKNYKNIRMMFPGFSEPDLEKEINAAIECAEQFLKQAQAAKNEKDIIDYCSKAYEACSDYPGVRELVLKYPPQAPTNLKVSVDGYSRTISLSWEKSPTDGLVSYIVMRKTNAVPINAGDGEMLGRVSMCGFNDGKIEPAVNYYYAVFAERAGVYSAALSSKTPAVNLFEISNVTITAGDSLLQLEWSALPKGATAEIYRKYESGEAKKINSTRSVSYLDSDLINDKPYHYKIRLAYNVNGNKQLTRGIDIMGIPTKLPAAIESLSIKPGDGDLFTAVWSNPDNVDVELYCSTERPDYEFGGLVAQKALETKMRRLALNRISGTSASFLYRGNELLYVVAAVVKSGSVIIGATARASKGMTVRISKIAAVNEKIHIYADVPREATGFVVLYRFDRYPEDISDVKTVRKYIPVKQYLHDGALVVDTLEPKNYYFSVFAEFMHNGEKDYSIGTDYLFSNVRKEVITYSINVSRKLLGKSYILLNFEAENRVFELPDIEIMSAVGNTPMFKTASKPFYDIPSQTVNGSIQVKIPLPDGLPDDTYIRAFLKDESLASTYQLKLKLRSGCKIS